MKEPTTTTTKRRRQTDEEGLGNNMKKTAAPKKKQKKEALKELVTSFLLLEQEEEQQKQITDRKKQTMIDYYNDLQDDLEQQLRLSTANKIAAAAAISTGGWNERRLWVKDRSTAWWNQCSHPDYPEADFCKEFQICGEMLRQAIPVRQRVAVCIWRLATGAPLRHVSERFGLGISTCHKLVLEVCLAIKTEKWKNNEKELNVVGSMYTTHIPIIVPKISVSAYFNKRHTERNRKTSYSITVRGVVDPKGVFTDVCIGWPGFCWFLTVNRILHGLNTLFNEKIGDIQRVGTSAFARLKGRWGCLQKRTEMKLQDLPVVLGACCVLHNICEMRNEEMDPDVKFELFDDEMIPENSLRSMSSIKTRDNIAHNLLHHGLAGTSFL
ncbi:hypothetical protein MKX03_013059 [Papaver bracteatum]|nr:hypothetical protein MKX03_013059 [Papaver bracteatum]